ncbi:MAG: response regulator transcription factor [Candidatus Eremiobacteraeota bacterium]|uniref:Two-component response regulator (YkoH) n=1 Tax=mine drainage metagenome TaxID=410659 RepID=E6Q3G5_9ZZZZ|nr:response regulator transcription factor [Candidatus Eremiobacteraeota bacterium]NNM92821.1 response regulator transcription factor [Candidatus Eremiobacteraeota bacterium]
MDATVKQRRIVVVEDDAAIARVLQLELQHEGYHVDLAQNGVEGLELALKEPDLVILDLMLPRMDGMEVCRRIRAKSRVPIIMLTAKDRVPDRVAGLDIGANDYLTKPFATEELLARVRAQLREREPQDRSIVYKDVVMDRDRHEVRRGGKEIALTAKEYALLEYLLLHRNKVHTRDELFNGVWGSDFLGDSNLIDVYVRYLRGKLEEGFDEKLISTVRGIGYTIKD